MRIFRFVVRKSMDTTVYSDISPCDIVNGFFTVFSDLGKFLISQHFYTRGKFNVQITLINMN